MGSKESGANALYGPAGFFALAASNFLLPSEFCGPATRVVIYRSLVHGSLRFKVPCVILCLRCLRLRLIVPFWSCNRNDLHKWTNEMGGVSGYEIHRYKTSSSSSHRRGFFLVYLRSRFVKTNLHSGALG